MKNIIKEGEKELRRFKYERLHPLTRDYLAGNIDVKGFGEKWSSIADHCCQMAYDIARQIVGGEEGSPSPPPASPCKQGLHGGRANLPPMGGGNNLATPGLRLAVIALGKLGAYELNYSSDIDLIFIYNDISHHETACRLASFITKLLSDITEDKFCFRVDNDLRPEGKNGPLANPIDSAIDYYQFVGAEWERMMLIRARPVAGDAELGKAFVEAVRPFVYRKSLDIQTLKTIKETKEKIGQEAARSAKGGLNIKLGEGGIREIEFVVQSLQILNGGRDSRLACQNTFEALQIISEAAYLPKKQCDKLVEAYTFLRHLENMMQLPEERQTHTLPAKADEIFELADRMGYSEKSGRTPAQQLLADLDSHTSSAKHQFQHMFQLDPDRQQMEEAIFTNIGTCEGAEEEIDSLAWFRNEETRRIQYLDLEKNMPPEKVSENLSLVAEVVLSEAYKIASEKLREIYGPPLASAGKNALASLSIVGMGKLGGREIDYASDLDLMFIFSDEGKTAGPKSISNAEYFTKLSQRIITLITLPTRYGHAYKIDADLRPSGRAGVLVSSLGSFKSYHLLEAGIWERQALIKARPVAGDPKFCDIVKKGIEEICFGPALPKDALEKIRGLRLRMEKERAGEVDNRYSIKFGSGGLMDIETIVQYMQLEHGFANAAVRSNNTLKALTDLSDMQIIDGGDAKILIDGYSFFRRLLSRIRLFSNHTTDFYTTDSEQMPQIAKTLGFNDERSLLNEFLGTRCAVRSLYNRLLPS